MRTGSRSRLRLGVGLCLLIVLAGCHAGGLVVRSASDSDTTTLTLSIETVSLASGTAGSAYSATLTATGGTTPYTWSLASGSSLPAGLSLSSAGTISGTPTAAGTATFTVAVVDSSSSPQSASKDLSITLSIPPLSVTTTALADGTVGTAYAGTLTGSGGTAPYTWAMAAGPSLPAGLTLDSSGSISGTPASAGTSSFTVTVEDSGSPQQSVSEKLSMTIGVQLSIMTVVLPTGTVGASYTAMLAAGGGASPYTWGLASGSSLPAGLNLDSSGTISGTPTAAGATTFAVTMEDSSSQQQSLTQQLSITVSAVPNTTAVCPGTADSGLVGWWTLDDGAGSAATDCSGSGNNGTWVGSQVGMSDYFAFGQVGAWSGEFDGATDYIGTAASPANLNFSAGDFTLAAWINSASFASKMPILGKGIGSTADNEYLFDTNSSGGLTLYYKGAWTDSASSVLSAGVWQHVAVVVSDGATVTFYVNGTQIGTATSAPSGTYGPTLSNPLYIGAQGNAAAIIAYQKFAGVIDDVRVYNSALAASAISQLWQSQRGVYAAVPPDTLAADSFEQADGALGSNWGTVVSLDGEGQVGCCGGIQVLNRAYAPLSSAGAEGFSTWASGSFSDDQYAQATVSAVAPFRSTLAITAATQSGSITTYTYTLTSGSPLMVNQAIIISGMSDAGNNGEFLTVSLGVGTFTVTNSSGVTSSGQTGRGVSPSDSGCGIVVRGTEDGKNGYYFHAGANSYRTTGTPYIVYYRELWKIVNGVETVLAYWDDAIATGDYAVGSVHPCTTCTFQNLPLGETGDSIGDIYTLVASGSTITVYKNGLCILSVSDTDLTSGVPGIYTWSLSGPNEYKWASWANSAIMTTDPPGDSRTQWTNWFAGDIP